MTRPGAAPIHGSGAPTSRLTERMGDAPHARQSLPCASLADVQTGPQLGSDQRPRAPGQPPARPPGYSFRQPGRPPGRAPPGDPPKLRRILRCSRTRPPAFPSETAFVRFLSPPLSSRRQGRSWPRRAVFFRAASCRLPVLVVLGPFRNRTEARLVERVWLLESRKRVVRTPTRVTTLRFLASP